MWSGRKKKENMLCKEGKKTHIKWGFIKTELHNYPPPAKDDAQMIVRDAAPTQWAVQMYSNLNFGSVEL